MDWLIPPQQFAQHVMVAAIAFAVTALVVVIHYDGVTMIARRYSRRVPRHDRRAMLKIIFALLALHVAEIWCYGFAYWGLAMVPGAGYVLGEHGADHLFDAVYFSAATYSTVGFGDLSPIGAVRLLAGLEAVTGLLLITWSASFTYLEMSRLWAKGPRD
jgi:hypothetical protein